MVQTVLLYMKYPSFALLSVRFVHSEASRSSHESHLLAVFTIEHEYLAWFSSVVSLSQSSEIALVLSTHHEHFLNVSLSSLVEDGVSAISFGILIVDNMGFHFNMASLAVMNRHVFRGFHPARCFGVSNDDFSYHFLACSLNV